jgi:hypothetical protein
MPQYLIERARRPESSPEEARARTKQAIEVAESLPGVVGKSIPACFGEALKWRY